jgi:hypothetical protein
LNQPTTSGYCQPSTSRQHDEPIFNLSNEDLSIDDQLDGLDDEEFTPPPSYMEVFEDANLSSKQISSSGPACGTL